MISQKAEVAMRIIMLKALARDLCTDPRQAKRAMSRPQAEVKSNLVWVFEQSPFRKPSSLRQI